MYGVSYGVEYESHHLVMVWVCFGIRDSDELCESGVWDGFECLDEGVDFVPPYLGVVV